MDDKLVEVGEAASGDGGGGGDRGRNGSDERQGPAKIKALTLVGGYLPVRDLLAARLACKQWNSALIPELRKKHKLITLTFPANQIPTLWNMVTGRISAISGSNNQVKTFTDVMKRSTELPFSKYQFWQCRETLEDFGTVCGATVTELNLHAWWDGKWVDKWETSSVREAIFEQMPNLTVLSLWFMDYNKFGIQVIMNELKKRWRWITPNFNYWLPSGNKPHDEEAPVPTITNQVLPKLTRFTFTYANQQPTACAKLVANIIQSAIELKELQFVSSEQLEAIPEYQEFVCGTFEQMLDSNRNIHKLKCLQIGNVSLPILQSLLKLGDREREPAEDCLRFETLEITVTGAWLELACRSPELTRILEAFLAQQAETLRQFTICLNPGADPPGKSMMMPIVLPCMERMLSLTIAHGIWNYWSRSLNRLPFDLHFDGDTMADTLPGLMKLKYYLNYQHLDAVDTSSLNMTRQNQIAHPGVTELIVEASLQQLAPLPTRFPSVTKLDLSLNLSLLGYADEVQTAFGHLWMLWPTLTHVQLRVDLESDSAVAARPDELFTGVARDQIGALKSELALVSASTDPLTLDKFRALLRKYKKRPSISDLNQLKDLKLDLFSPKQPRPTECSITDVGCYCGLALIGTQLQRIRIGGNLHNLVSKPCLQFMKSGSVFGPNAVLKMNTWEPVPYAVLKS